MSFAGIYSEKESKVTISHKNMTVKSILDHIEKTENYIFIYQDDNIDLDRETSIEANNESIFSILDALFKETGNSYKVVDKQIYITKSNEVAPAATVTAVQQRGVSVRGNVVDGFGEPLIGVSIRLRDDATVGVITDFDGNFSLDNVPEGAILHFTYIGMKEEFYTVKSDAFVNITMQDDSDLLDEVVVVGYGVQKKVNLTGSVASISTKDIQDRVQTDVLSAVQGTVPGVTIISRPGQTPSINFRGRGNLGTSEPLYVIDGVITDATFFSNLDPNSIESLSFLKDAASSAIYGSRAAYGVVLVTTKTGTKDRMQVSYNGHVGVKMANYLPKIVNSPQYAEMLNEGRYNNNPSQGKNQAFTDDEIELFRNGYSPDLYPDTDWLDLVLDKSVITTQHSVNFNGGSERIRYFTGLGYTFDDSHMPGSDMQRYNVNINLSADATKWMTINSGVKYIKRQSDRDGGSVGGMNLLITPPTMVSKQSNGEWGSMAGGKQATQEFIRYNPLRNLNKNDWSKSSNEWTMYELGIDIKPIQDLVITGQGSYRRGESKSKSYTALQDNVNLFTTGNPILGTGNAVNQMSMGWGSTSNLLMTLTGAYNLRVNNHNFDFLAGTSFEDYRYQALSGSRKNFPSDALEDMNAGSKAGIDITNGGGMQSNRMLSYFGRINYNYAERYLLEMNMRADASSRFHKDHRMGYFPSFSAAWRISEESFMEDNKSWLDNLKVRASWGELGNINNVGNYDYFMRYAASGNYNFDDSVAMGIAESKMANNKLGWETVSLTNFGIDADFFGGKLGVVADYYIKETKDILLSYNVPLETGITAVPSQNIGNVKNSGFEFAVSHNNKIGEVSYSIGANIATNRNRITNLAGSDDMIQNGGDKIRYILKEGEAIGSYFGYKTDGLYSQEEIDAGHFYTFGRKPNAGDIKYVPQRDDVEWGSAITGDDRTIIGKDVPDFTYGLNINVNWKNFELGLFGQGVSGTSVAFESEQVWAFFLNSSPREIHLNRWTEENQNSRAPYPRIYGGSSKDDYNQNFSDYQLFDSDYFRIKTVSLGYSIPKHVSQKAGLQTIKVFLTGENLLTFRADKDMKDFDPEASSGRGIGSFGNRSVAVGLNVSF